MPRGHYKRSSSRSPVQVIGPSIARFELTKGFWATIDAEDIEIVGKHTWSAHNTRGNWYARARVNGKLTCLHRFLIGVENLETDHRNGNRLDNRRGNLRPATKSQNMRNKRVSSSSISGYKGVKRNGSGWQARIGIDGKRESLGTYKTREEAHAAYCEAANRLFGEFASDGVMTLSLD